MASIYLISTIRAAFEIHENAGPMPVTIIKKVSNKNQTHPKNQLPNPNGPSTADTKKAGQQPFIDKLSIVIAPRSEQAAYGMHSSILTQFQDKGLFQAAGKEALKGYNRAQLIALESTL